MSAPSASRPPHRARCRTPPPSCERPDRRALLRRNAVGILRRIERRRRVGHVAKDVVQRVLGHVTKNRLPRHLPRLDDTPASAGPGRRASSRNAARATRRPPNTGKPPPMWSRIPPSAIARSVSTAICADPRRPSADARGAGAAIRTDAGTSAASPNPPRRVSKTPETAAPIWRARPCWPPLPRPGPLRGPRPTRRSQRAETRDSSPADARRGRGPPSTHARARRPGPRGSRAFPIASGRIGSGAAVERLQGGCQPHRHRPAAPEPVVACTNVM